MKQPNHYNFSNFVAKRLHWLFYPFLKYIMKYDTFRYNGKEYSSFLDKYNVTPVNERQVEIPIIRGELPNILEVGNVLQHYGANWDVVDKYEKGKGVINCDITRFKPNKKYDKIVSISTLEHLGERTGHSRQKILKAIKHLKSLLNKGGKLVFTVPLGWNSAMDDLIFRKKLGVKMRFMRLNETYDWIECSMENAKGIEYGEPNAFANAIMIGEYVK